MSAIFFLALIIILVGLVGLTLQNLSLSISLVFLGLRSQPISLGFLILGALAAGVVTGLVIIGLLSLSNHLAQRRLQSRPKTEGPRFRQPWQTKSSDPETDSSWGSESDEPMNQTGYEVEQQPKTTQQSGSTYSYSYRDDNQTGVGRPESVVDADYRVVTPPYQVSDQDPDDDYGFDFDDEDFADNENEDKDKPGDPKR